MWWFWKEWRRRRTERADEYKCGYGAALAFYAVFPGDPIPRNAVYPDSDFDRGWDDACRNIGAER